MTSQKLKPTTIEGYIDASPAEVQEKLLQIHNCIREAAPGAKEVIKWGMPTYSYQKILVAFAVFKLHIGFYPMQSVIEKFGAALAKYNTAKSTIQFPLDEPLPMPLIRKIVKFRVKESKDGAIKWKS